MANCFHCGDDCGRIEIIQDNHPFCCHGCTTVYEILNANDLGYYYELESTPGKTPMAKLEKFNYLENEEIVKQLIDFEDDSVQIASFFIPNIHCSSCIWILENLNKLSSEINTSTVDFSKKTARITWDKNAISLKDLVRLLAKLGYAPDISLKDSEKEHKRIDRQLIYKLGVAGFAFGNIMFLSFPEYFEVSEFWLDRFKYLFRWLMFVFSLPVVFYSGRDYFVSAFKGIRSKFLNIDVPIAIGIAILFIRSTIDIILDLGSGFFDSLSGLVFFLLLGKFFQQKTYAFLSFERDYKSYFPIAVTLISKGKESYKPVHEITTNDNILIRNEEIIPVDGILEHGDAIIDYSFVTGEANPISVKIGTTIFAGGKQLGAPITLRVIKSIEQSYLTQLWSHDTFKSKAETSTDSFVNQISQKFTSTVLLIATLSGLFWIFYDFGKVFNVVTAVLIVACPCAIALSTPFTLGNLLRIFGRKKLYLKSADVIEKMAGIDTLVFDKTGTLTSHQKSVITYEGIELTKEEKNILTSSLRSSNHPLSRALYDILDQNNIQTLDEIEEIVGHGLRVKSANRTMKIGSESFVVGNSRNGGELDSNKTTVHISCDDQYKGYYIFQIDYRDGLQQLFEQLKNDKEIYILSGDNEGEKAQLEQITPKDTVMMFNQKPEQKLVFIEELQKNGNKVMMIGDGLNDAGALRQSDVGIAISEDINVFSPACDGILDASMLSQLANYLKISTIGLKIIKWSLLFSLLYNLAGLSFAITGNLTPVVAAILMPLSSISIVVFTTVATQLTHPIKESKIITKS